MKSFKIIFIISLIGNSLSNQLVPDHSNQESPVQLLKDEVQKPITQESFSFYGSSCAEPSPVSQSSKLQAIILPEYSKYPFMVACDMLTLGGGWTIFLQRSDGSEDFYRNWNDYKHGFGTLENEFFLGLEKLRAFTVAQQQELLVLLEDYEGNRRYQLYDNFKIGNEIDSYKLISVGKSSGNAGDSLSVHLGCNFSTYDRDTSIDKNCAVRFTGAWWYKNCHQSNLAGKYGDHTFGKGVNWYNFHGYEYPMKKATMMIRPRH